MAKGFIDNHVSFAISDRSDFSNEVEALGAQAKDPTAAIYDSKGKYAMEKDFSVDALREFVQDYLDGQLEPYIKSEPVPADNEGPVKVRCSIPYKILVFVLEMWFELYTSVFL